MKYLAKHIPIICLTVIVVAEIVCKTDSVLISGTLLLAMLFEWFRD